MSGAWPLDAEPTVGSAPPWAGAAAPAPAVRRRENLRSASFRDYAMARVTPAPDPKKRMRAEFTLSPRRARLEKMTADNNAVACEFGYSSSTAWRIAFKMNRN